MTYEYLGLAFKFNIKAEKSAFFGNPEVNKNLKLAISNIHYLQIL
jgi:hypothetical protein